MFVDRTGDSMFDAAEIAFAGAWDDAPDLFDTALINAGFLDENRTIHDWMEYAGRLVQARKRKAASMRRQRNVTLPERDVTNRTVPNSTVPKETNVSLTPKKEKNETKKTEVTPEFIAKLKVDFPDRDVDGLVADAMAHKAYDKWNGKQRYVRNWVRDTRVNGGSDGQPHGTSNLPDESRAYFKSLG